MKNIGIIIIPGSSSASQLIITTIIETSYCHFPPESGCIYCKIQVSMHMHYALIDLHPCNFLTRNLLDKDQQKSV